MPTDLDDETLDDFDAIEDDTENFERFHDSRVKAKASKKQVAETRKLAESDENVLFETTYKPSRHEAAWLYSSLKPFFEEQKLIDDVLFQVKGGKEASVYCCRVHPDVRSAFGVDQVAAKVYRPRQFRNLRNDALYRQGRAVLTDEGRAAKNSDQRLMRALGKKTDFGAQVQHTSWLLYEYTTLQTLFREGCAVPEPYAVAENAILMGFIGDETRAAATLIEIGLDKPEANRVFGLLKESLVVLARLGLVHGDLSAYNVLYDGERPVLIDFPQVVRLGENEAAEEIWLRDLTRLCEYFSRLGVDCDPQRLRKELLASVPPSVSLTLL